MSKTAIKEILLSSGTRTMSELNQAIEAARPIWYKDAINNMLLQGGLDKETIRMLL